MSPIPRCPECKEIFHGRACFCQRHAGLKSQKANPQSGESGPGGEAANSGRSSKGNRVATNAKNKQQSMKKIQDKAIAKKSSTGHPTGPGLKPGICSRCGQPIGCRPHRCKGEGKRWNKRKGGQSGDKKDKNGAEGKKK